MASKSFFAVVAGVGPGTGGAAALRFARAYPVVLLARRQESYAGVVAEIEKAGGKAIGISTDISDAASVRAAFDQIKKDLPGFGLAAAVYNAAAGFAIKPFLESTAEELDVSLTGNARGLHNFAKASLPLLLESVDSSPLPPTLVVTGSTAAVRGSAKFGVFAAGSFAKRALAQSLAREFGPQGVHVSHVIVDGIINTEKTANWSPNGGVKDGKIEPDAIAETFWQLHAQPRSAFAHELDLRPFVEKF